MVEESRKEGKATTTSAAQAITPRTSPPKQKRLPSPSWGGAGGGGANRDADAKRASERTQEAEIHRDACAKPNQSRWLARDGFHRLEADVQLHFLMSYGGVSQRYSVFRAS